MSDAELELAYEEDYRIEDQAFFEPFVVKKASNPGRIAWWNGEAIGGGKVRLLLAAFKMDLTVQEACIYAAISFQQYKYFCQIHPEFTGLKSRLKGVLAIAAKQGLVGDIAHKEGYRSRQWYLERKQPKLYGRPHEIPELPDGATSLTALVQRAFTDEDGKTITQTTASRITKDDTGGGK